MSSALEEAISYMAANEPERAEAARIELADILAHKKEIRDVAIAGCYPDKGRPSMLIEACRSELVSALLENAGHGPNARPMTLVLDPILRKHFVDVTPSTRGL